MRSRPARLGPWPKPHRGACWVVARLRRKHHEYRLFVAAALWAVPSRDGNVAIRGLRPGRGLGSWGAGCGPGRDRARPEPVRAHTRRRSAALGCGADRHISSRRLCLRGRSLIRRRASLDRRWSMNGHRSNWLLISLLAAAVAVAAPLKAAPGSNDSQVTFHFAGYADATFTDTQGEAGSLGEVTFAPIFHIQVGERFLFEAEAEFEADDRGGKAAGLEYATASWLLNDSSALVVGKFLSPVGYFLQNLHPSWINKLASVPAGFGHGGAAPLTDVGVQLRGGHAFSGGHRLN